MIAPPIGWSNVIARVRTRVPARDVGGWLSALVEMLGLLLWLLLFPRLQSAAGKDIASATANALTLQSMERAVHIDIERSTNHWLAGHLVLSHLAMYLYRLYYAVIVGVLVWVFVRHADIYRKVRRTMSSLPVGYSLCTAYAVWSVFRAEHPRLTLLPWTFPLLMTADVIATGNHHVLDVAGSLVLLTVSIAAVSMVDRLADRRRSVHT